MPKMRLGWYAGASTVLAGSVVLSAFHQRANFYSAMVYMAQSNFCLIVMVNFTLFLYSTFIYGLTRVCFGSLRAIEVEVLTERAWFAITETCLAMTIFREEIGAWFLVMFTALVTGKVWGWIADGRVEILEQQPPANPRLFHTRLSISLIAGCLYNSWILQYAIATVIQQARPNMMVMFLFEFAVLTTTSYRTGCRYLLSIAEQRIIKAQTQTRLQQRRQETAQQRDTMLRDREAAISRGEEPPNASTLPPNPDDIEEMDIEVPGWAAKGEWVLWLDLLADLFKLAIYVTFFFMLLMFYGLPIHIIRDLFMTTRDFFKRAKALLRYRKAIKEMNSYPDATTEDLARDSTCIICREEMRPWDASAESGAIDRVRPKKLPCGHILHLGCLKSWLERQQVCPICRTPVTGPAARPPANRGGALRIQFGIGAGREVNAAPGPAVNGNADADAAINNAGNAGVDGQRGQREVQNQPPQGQPANGGARVFRFGPFRVGLAGNQQQFNQLLHRGAGVEPNPGNQAPPASRQVAHPSTQAGIQGDNLATASELLEQSIQAIQREFQALTNTQSQLHVAQLLLVELHRLRQQQQLQQQQGVNHEAAGLQQAAAMQPPLPNLGSLNTHGVPSGATPGPGTFPHFPSVSGFSALPPRLHSPGLSSRLGASGHSIPAGSPDLPEGVVLPSGWSLMPLQRMDGAPPMTQPQTQPSELHRPSEAEAAASASQAQIPSQTSDITNRHHELSSLSSGIDVQSNNSSIRSEAPTGMPSTREQAYANSNTAVPQWGGSAQLFGASPNPSINRPQPDEPRREESEQGSHSAKSASSENTSSSNSGSGEESDEQTESSNMAKGKARAVTIEEASDDSDDSD